MRLSHQGGKGILDSAVAAALELHDSMGLSFIGGLLCEYSFENTTAFSETLGIVNRPLRSNRGFLGTTVCTYIGLNRQHPMPQQDAPAIKNMTEVRYHRGRGVRYAPPNKPGGQNHCEDW